MFVFCLQRYKKFCEQHPFCRLYLRVRPVNMGAIASFYQRRFDVFPRLIFIFPEISMLFSRDCTHQSREKRVVISGKNTCNLGRTDSMSHEICRKRRAQPPVPPMLSGGAAHDRRWRKVRLLYLIKQKKRKNLCCYESLCLTLQAIK